MKNPCVAASWLEDQDIGYKHKYLCIFVIWVSCLARDEATFKEFFWDSPSSILQIKHALSEYEQPSK